MSIFASIKNFFSRGKAPVAKAAPAVAGPDRPGLGNLHSKADVSPQVSGMLGIEEKVRMIGLVDAIPFIGGAKSGFRQTINASRVNASMPTEKDMNRVLNTLTL